eukprot:gnl/TRDRNA2_/TRDRNA2_83983_c0_seq1.p1 gnl/TRDRNA2_/TRDRNA2_83983_c0~~gnl/TRDRNA2_/TRDRNA2_83983_c0_seq1.p1  ORF type:complete len:620 (+),score=112.69 gnl/TRDRNA2_/TRDRNA2_83983_c0_seq1:250-2109(+)
MQSGKISATGMSIIHTVGMFGVFFLMLLVTPLMFIFLYHQAPLLTLFVSLILFLLALTPLYGQQGGVLASALTVSMLVSVMVSLHCYYNHIMPARWLEEGRLYTGVYAQQPAAAFSDAAIVRFAGGAKVDDTQALGVKDLDGGIMNYCVAPIIDEQFVGRVEYWAIGVNCCDKMGNFECNDARLENINSGFVVHDPAKSDVLFWGLGKYLAPPEARRDMFMKAVRLAEKVHGVVSSDKPMFLKWSGKTKQEWIQQESTMIWVTIAVLAVYAIINALILSFLEKKFMNWQEGAKKLNAHLQKARALKGELTAAADVFVSRTTNADVLAVTWQELILMSLVAPFLTINLCNLFMTYVHCWRFANTWLWIFYIVVLTVVVSLLMTPKKGTFGTFLLMCAATGIYLGSWNYQYNAHHYCQIRQHRAYSNVLAEAKAIEYSDAGKVEFAAPAYVDREKSVGFLLKGINYCAAPVMSQATPTRVEFWAVGIECCSPRGGFYCDDVKDPEARGGVVLRNYTSITGVSTDWDASAEENENYLRAVKASSDLHHFMRPPQPILLRWSKDLAAMEEMYKGASLGLLVMTLIITLLVLAVVTGISIWYVNFHKRKLADEEKKYGKKPGAP